MAKVFILDYFLGYSGICNQTEKTDNSPTPVLWQPMAGQSAVGHTSRAGQVALCTCPMVGQPAVGHMRWAGQLTLFILLEIP